MLMYDLQEQVICLLRATFSPLVYDWHLYIVLLYSAYWSLRCKKILPAKYTNIQVPIINSWAYLVRLEHVCQGKDNTGKQSSIPIPRDVDSCFSKIAGTHDITITATPIKINNAAFLKVNFWTLNMKIILWQ